VVGGVPVTARDVLDAVADEFGVPFVVRPFNDRAFLDLLMDRLKRETRHDLSDCLDAVEKAGKL
jgi:hypothetical protein